MVRSNQNGFNIPVILLATLIIGIIGLTGWYINQVKNNSYNSTTSPTTSPKSTAIGTSPAQSQTTISSKSQSTTKSTTPSTTTTTTTTTTPTSSPPNTGSAIVGVLQNITDCGGTAESSPQCGYVLEAKAGTYSLQGAAAQKYLSGQYAGKTFQVYGTVSTGGTNQFGLPEPSTIDVTSMVEQ